MTTSESEPASIDAAVATESQLLTPNETENFTQSSRLLEFPGVSRSSMPEWRKEIAERVREAQERRAREAAAEAEMTLTDEVDRPLPQLELLPQAEAPPMNPLVAAALKRIERAHADPAPAMAHASRPSRMTALAYATENAYPSLAAQPLESPMTNSPTLLAPTSDHLETLDLIEDQSSEVEKTHNLVVVPPSINTVDETKEIINTRPKPRRIIGDDPNNPALNYLDSISTMIHPEDVTNLAPAFRRLLAGVVDLIMLALLFTPFAAGVELLKRNWLDLQVIALAAATLLVLSFLYSTICTALTGRTLGMKLLSLRVVDARTGLIPTGKQSAGRALLFNFSLLSAGIILAYALLDSEKRTAHDKFTKTAVIKA